MIEAIVALSLITVILLIIAWRRKDGSIEKAVRSAYGMFKGIAVLLVFAFLLSGMLHAAVPPELIKKLLGEEAGLRGIFIGMLGGAIIPGGPYVSFPIISSVYTAGAGIGTVIAFITGWAMMGIGKIPFELAILGTRFTWIRIVLFILFPLLAGWVAYMIL